MVFRIKDARERANIDQRNLAKMLGIAPSTLSGYESGTHDPKSDILSRIADICNVSTDFLLGRETEDDNSTNPVDRLTAIVHQLTPEQACFMVKLVENLLQLNPDAYAAACKESKNLWKG